jgi:hypothetical protein
MIVRKNQMTNEPVTRADLDKTLEVHAKAIELQILISQQQERIVEKQDSMEGEIEKLNGHFSNGFKQDIKDHITKELSTTLGKLNTALEEMNKLLGAINDRGWKQQWMWAGITLFTIANAIGLIYTMWTNGFVVRTP